MRRPGECRDHQDPRRRECPAQGSCIFTFSTKQPDALCEPALLHPLPGPHTSSAGPWATDAAKEIFCHLMHPRQEPFQSQRQKGEPSQAHRADSARESCPLSGPLSPALASPKAASPVYACRRPSLSSGRRSMCPLSQTPFKSKAIQTGQQTLGRLIIRLGSSWPTDSLLSPSPSFLVVGVTWGTSLSGSSPPGLPAGGGGMAKTPAEPG